METIRAQQSEQQKINFCGSYLNPQTHSIETQYGNERLRNKLWQVLVELVYHPNKLVLRNSLVRDIWHGNIYTGEQGLTHTICHLRRILKKHKIQAKIITLPKRGYILQFIQPKQDFIGPSLLTLTPQKTKNSFSAIPNIEINNPPPYANRR